MCMLDLYFAFNLFSIFSSAIDTALVGYSPTECRVVVPCVLDLYVATWDQICLHKSQVQQYLAGLMVQCRFPTPPKFLFEKDSAQPGCQKNR